MIIIFKINGRVYNLKIRPRSVGNGLLPSPYQCRRKLSSVLSVKRFVALVGDGPVRQMQLEKY
jgi:hypothetical protein